MSDVEVKGIYKRCRLGRQQHMWHSVCAHPMFYSAAFCTWQPDPFQTTNLDLYAVEGKNGNSRGLDSEGIGL